MTREGNGVATKHFPECLAKSFKGFCRSMAIAASGPGLPGSLKEPGARSGTERGPKSVTDFGICRGIAAGNWDRRAAA
jgi:hypothetical protein